MMASEDDAKEQASDTSGEVIADVSAHSEIEERTGYRRPPPAHRFKPGQSGNLKGRPKNARSRREIVRRVLLEKRRVDLRGSGPPRDLTTLELVVLRLRQHALEGKTRAFKDYKALEARFTQQESGKKGGYLMVPHVESWADWVRLFGPKDELPDQNPRE